MKSAAFAVGAVLALASADHAFAEPGQRRWDGMYLGLSAGGGVGALDTRILVDIGLLPPGSVVAQDQCGVIGGGHVGYNVMSGPWLFGVEAGFSWAGINGSGRRVSTTDPDWTVRTKGDLDWIASAVARVGYTTDNALVYAKGGIATADVSMLGYSTYLGTYAGGGRIDQRFTGWTIGIGSEFAVNDRWSVRFDYDYFDFGRERLNISGTDLMLTTQHHVGRVGISYALGGVR